jgi:hypothetical protein
MAIEYVNTLARVAGFKSNSLSVGIAVQNSLGVASRAVSFLVIPLISLMADKNVFSELPTSALIALNFIAPAILALAYISRERLAGCMLYTVRAVNERGRIELGYAECKVSKPLAPQPLVNYFRIQYLAYISYYLAWPVTIAVLREFPSYRATALSLSTVFTGINTLMIILIIDPKTMYLQRYDSLFEGILINQLRTKLTAATHAALIFSLLAVLRK